MPAEFQKAIAHTLTLQNFHYKLLNIKNLTTAFKTHSFLEEKLILSKENYDNQNEIVKSSKK